MIRVFSYTNSKGERKYYRVYEVSETPEYLMGIDLKKALDNAIGDPDWTELNYCFFSKESNGIIMGDLLNLVAAHIVNVTENNESAMYDFWYFDKNFEIPSTFDEDFLKAYANKSSTLKDCDIPNFDKAVKTYEGLQKVLSNRPASQYGSLQESRAAGKEKIEGLNPEWMKAFKNFKKSGIEQ